MRWPRSTHGLKRGMTSHPTAGACPEPFRTWFQGKRLLQVHHPKRKPKPTQKQTPRWRSPTTRTRNPVLVVDFYMRRGNRAPRDREHAKTFDVLASRLISEVIRKGGIAPPLRRTPRSTFIRGSPITGGFPLASLPTKRDHILTLPYVARMLPTSKACEAGGRFKKYKSLQLCFPFPFSFILPLSLSLSFSVSFSLLFFFFLSLSHSLLFPFLSHLSICHISPSLYIQNVNLSFYCLSRGLSIASYLSMYLDIEFSIYLVLLLAYLTIFLSIGLSRSIYLSINLSVCLPVCLSTYIALSA